MAYSVGLDKWCSVSRERSDEQAKKGRRCHSSSEDDTARFQDDGERYRDRIGL